MKLPISNRTEAIAEVNLPMLLRALNLPHKRFQNGWSSASYRRPWSEGVVHIT